MVECPHRRPRQRAFTLLTGFLMLYDPESRKRLPLDEMDPSAVPPDQPVTVVVPDVDRAGPVRAAGEPDRLVREVLKPLAAIGTVRPLVATERGAKALPIRPRAHR